MSMAIVAVTGGGFASTQVFILSALLRTAQSEYRGRVMSLRSLAIYAFALGSMSSGAMAGFWGAPRAANIVGITGIVLVLILAVWRPSYGGFSISTLRIGSSTRWPPPLAMTYKARTVPTVLPLISRHDTIRE